MSTWKLIKNVINRPQIVGTTTLITKAEESLERYPRYVEIKYLIHSIIFKAALLDVIIDLFESKWFTCFSTPQLFSSCYQRVYCICTLTGPATTSGFSCMTTFFLAIAYDEHEALVFGERSFLHFSASLIG